VDEQFAPGVADVQRVAAAGPVGARPGGRTQRRVDRAGRDVSRAVLGGQRGQPEGAHTERISGDRLIEPVLGKSLPAGDVPGGRRSDQAGTGELGDHGGVEGVVVVRVHDEHHL
jgi:hypothetical protein